MRQRLQFLPFLIQRERVGSILCVLVYPSRIILLARLIDLVIISSHTPDLRFPQVGGVMSTAKVSFSVPVEVKEEFNRIFSERNKNQIIAQYMMRAIEEHKEGIYRKKAIAKIRSK